MATPTPGTIPGGWCPTTWQSVLNQFASLLNITFPTTTNVIIQEAEPGVDDRDKLWIKLLPAAPWVEGSFVYTQAEWRQIPGIPIYFTDTGAANALEISTGASITSTAFLAGRMFLVKAANANTGAVTLAVDSVAAKNVKKQGVNDLVSGDYVAGQILLLVYDSVADNFELVTTLGDGPSTIGSAVIYKTVAAGAASQQVNSIAETVVEIGGETDPDGIVSIASNKFTLQPGSYLLDVYVPIVNTSDPLKCLISIYDATANTRIASSGVYKSGDTDETSVHVKHAMTIGTQTDFEIRVQFDIANANTYLGAPVNIGGVAERYTQVSILKYA